MSDIPKSNPTKRIIALMASDTQCIPDDDGLLCVSKDEKKIYQSTLDGTSVAKVIENHPSEYEENEDGLYIKNLDVDCRISTKYLDNGSKSSILMCFAPNNQHIIESNDPELLTKEKIATDMENMNTKVESHFRQMSM